VFKSLATPVEVPWLRDLKVRLEPSDEQSHVLMKWGLYEPESLRFVERSLTPGGLAVDVGANCGLFTLVAARAVGTNGRVIALEPSRREFERLQDNIALNHFSHVRTLALAATENRGHATLRVAEPPFSGHNTLGGHFAHEIVGLAELIATPTDTLDEILRNETRCDLIKIDVEGAELRALRGGEAALRRLRPTLLLEVNPAALAANGTGADELLAWLTNEGYELSALDESNGELMPFSGDVVRSVNLVARPKGR
jgi:FkbM family methyltransferase